MTETSVIGAGTIVSGHVRGQGSLEILGRVEGDVSVTGNVVIGPAGRVRGNVSVSAPFSAPPFGYSASSSIGPSIFPWKSSHWKVVCTVVRTAR